MGNNTEQIVGRIRHSAEALIRNITAMPADKLAWKPLDTGRTALDMAIECGAMSYLSAKCLTTRENPVVDNEAYQRIQSETDTAEKVAALISSGTEAFIAAVQAFPAEHLEDKVMMPWGMEITFSELMMLVHWNNVYHTGQIAYIQTLYGDKEMH